MSPFPKICFAFFSQGFPFDDEEPLTSRSLFGRNRSRPREFVDRAAGFADTYHEPPWEEEHAPKRRVVVDPEEDSIPTGPAPLYQQGLRNTVPLVQPPNTEREGRAMSAPPSDRPGRFVSTCEIPVKDIPVQHQQTSQQPQQERCQNSGNNVRVIPIQVEGRDEPLINSNIDTSTNFGAEPPSFEGRLPRDFGPFKKHSTRFQSSPPPPQYHHPPQQQQQPTPKHQQAPPKPQPKPQQTQPPSTPSQKSVDETDRATPQPPADPVALAMAKIAEVQREVEALAKQVNEATPVDRKDKQYVYLDEMLTRQLLHLDNVDPAGHDNVRQARKNAIKSIQQCISVLESRVPAEPMEVEGDVSNEQMSQEESQCETEAKGEPCNEEAAKGEEMIADASPVTTTEAEGSKSQE